MTTPEWGDKAAAMAREGSTIPKIAKEIGVDYWDVCNHVRNAQGTEFVGWRGAKWMITHRLNLLVKENDADKRKVLKGQVATCSDYLYKEGQRLGRKIESARKALAY